MVQRLDALPHYERGLDRELDTLDMSIASQVQTETIKRFESGNAEAKQFPLEDILQRSRPHPGNS